MDYINKLEFLVGALEMMINFVVIQNDRILKLNRTDQVQPNNFFFFFYTAGLSSNLCTSLPR